MHYYRYKAAHDEGGVEALFDQNRRSPNIKNRVDPAIEVVVVEYAIEEPVHDLVRTSNELRRRATFSLLRVFTLSMLSSIPPKRQLPQPICSMIASCRFTKNTSCRFFEFSRIERGNIADGLIKYNIQRTSQGKMCCGRALMETLTNGNANWKEKFLN